MQINEDCGVNTDVLLMMQEKFTLMSSLLLDSLLYLILSHNNESEYILGNHLM